MAGDADVIDCLGRDHGAALSSVEGIGLSGQMHGAVLLDESGAVLRPAILWNDVRATAECAELESRFPDAPAGDGQYRHARLHRAQAAVGAPARADGVRPGRTRCCCRKLISAIG